MSGGNGTAPDSAFSLEAIAAGLVAFAVAVWVAVLRRRGLTPAERRRILTRQAEWRSEIERRYGMPYEQWSAMRDAGALNG